MVKRIDLKDQVQASDRRRSATGAGDRYVGDQGRTITQTKRRDSGLYAKLAHSLLPNPLTYLHLSS